MRNDKPNLIVDMTFNFAVHTINFCEELDKMNKFKLSGQLFRSATSIGANVREAQNAERKNDFIHKLKIAAKEADETLYWLALCKSSPILPTNEELYLKAEQMMRVLSKIIASSKSRNSQ